MADDLKVFDKDWHKESDHKWHNSNFDEQCDRYFVFYTICAMCLALYAIACWR